MDQRIVLGSLGQVHALLEVVDGFLHMAMQIQSRRAVVPVGPVVGVQMNGDGKVGNGLPVAAYGVVPAAPSKVVGSIEGIKRNTMGVSFNGFLILADQAQSRAVDIPGIAVGIVLFQQCLRFLHSGLHHENAAHFLVFLFIVDEFHVCSSY